MVKNYYFKSSCLGKMIRFLRWNWIIRGDVVTPVCKIVLFYFIASKKSKNYHLLWFLVTTSEKNSYFRDTHSFQDYVSFKNLKKSAMSSLLKSLSDKFTGDVIFVKFDTSTGILSYQEIDSEQFKELIKLRIKKIKEETDKVEINEILKTIEKLTKEEKTEIIKALIK